jgi:hypothetical protein
VSIAAGRIGTSPTDAVAIVAHDAGGAEVLSSYVRQQGLTCRLALQGPACAVFERKLGPYQNLTVEAAVRGGVSLLCGTSWQSDLELHAIELARAGGKPSAAWLDHWVQFRERFARFGTLCLPDEVWVSDTDAFALARKLLPGLPVRLMENPYFADIKTDLASAARVYPAIPGQQTILYVCEPVREAALRQFGNALHWGYTEEQALQYFLSNLGSLGAPVGHIVIRPHPSEAAGKYRGIVAEHALPLSFSRGHDLSAEIASCDCVVGCGSMAMVIGLLAGKRVVSCIPPGGAPCPLPQHEIELLRDLVRLDRAAHR